VVGWRRGKTSNLDDGSENFSFARRRDRYEVTREAVKMLEHVAAKWKHCLKLGEGLLGGIALHRTGTPFPEETAPLAADATLMGAVGLPEFDNAPPEKRPEKGLLGIRKALGVR
jgi:3-isopropylmalate dehydrogenase